MDRVIWTIGIVLVAALSVILTIVFGGRRRRYQDESPRRQLNDIQSRTHFPRL